MHQTIQTHYHKIIVEGDYEAFQFETSVETVDSDIDLLHIKLDANIPTQPPDITLRWECNLTHISSLWYPGADRRKMLPPPWEGSFISKAAFQAPVCCLYAPDGYNQLTFAVSDAMHALKITPIVNEYQATFLCHITFFVEPEASLDNYQVTLRLDTRNIPYYEALKQVQRWWETFPSYQPASVPEIARLPVYSTWYSFHQQITASEIEKQCQMAKAAGCEVVIVDDGWHTSTAEGGYRYCGDWQVATEKFPDMPGHVKRVHDLGMKYMLWYAVPFVGKRSQSWQKFSQFLLEIRENDEIAILDPRFPAVRNYIIEIYERAVIDWDLDGLKLDFVNSFALPEHKREEIHPEQDYRSVSEAVDRLMTDIIERLRHIKNDILIEFRQPYIGPLMRKYGNMLRAVDCPHDAQTNRVRTIDTRLLAGQTAVHSDMLIWNTNESVESAALQLINILFSVPQISLQLETLSPSHQAMLSFWLTFWRNNRDVLLDGDIMPLYPEGHYPLVQAKTAQKYIAVMYQDCLITPGKNLPDTLLLVNGTYQQRMVLEIEHSEGLWQLTQYNCCGDVVEVKEIKLTPGFHVFAVSPCSVISLQKHEKSL